MSVQLPQPRPGEPARQDPERMVVAALRAQASVAGRAAPVGAPPAADRAAARIRLGRLLLALLIGLAIGIGLAMLSLLAPGVLPAIG